MKGGYFVILIFISLTCISEINSIGDHAWRTDDEVMALYEEWMLEHGRVYNAVGEKIDRFEIFKENLRYIEEENRLQSKTYELGLNQFSDLTNEEFKSIYLSNPIDINDEFKSDNCYVPEVNYSSLLPASVDWRAEGAVVPVKNQEGCGSCWAFAAMATVEALIKIKTGKLISLSEQMLVDCVTKNEGCQGGRVSNAFKYMQSHGVASTEHYPYKGLKEQCQNKNIAVKIGGFKWVNPRNEEGLLRATTTQVVSVAVKAGHRNFQLYKSGIYHGQCGNKIDHGVNVVGYGSENGKKYWIIRNSWGETWGENGYMRIARNAGRSQGHCGITVQPSVPVMSSINEELLSILISYHCLKTIPW